MFLKPLFQRAGRELLSVAAFIALLLVVMEISGLREHFSIAYLQQQILDNKINGLLVFVLLFVVGNLAQIPGLIFLGAAVLTLGKTWGGLATYIAATVSCLSTFLTIRLIGGDALRQLSSPLALRIFGQIDAHPTRSVFLLRIILQTFPPLNFSLALSGVRFRAYAIGTLLGLPFPIAVYCLLFDSFASRLLPATLPIH